MPASKMTIDRVVRPLVDNLNRLPGLTTTSSCQGHYDWRRPHVAFVCDEDTLRLILAAVTVLNSEERRQVRAYVEILDYGEGKMDVVLRFHHLFARVKPKRDTVLEWHRRINAMNDLIEGELECGLLRNMEARLRSVSGVPIAPPAELSHFYPSPLLCIAKYLLFPL